MSLLDVFFHALGNLRRQKLRTFLTVFGVAVGVATIVIMVSFGAGVRKLVADKFDRAEILTQIQVQPIKMPRSFADFRKFSEHPPKPMPLDEDAIAKLKEIAGVAAVFPDVNAPLTLELASNVEVVSTQGFPASALTATHRDALRAGVYWNDDDAANVCVIPATLVSTLGFKEPKDAIGATLTLARFDEFMRYDQDPPLDQPDKIGPDGKPLPRKLVRRKGAKIRELQVIGVYDPETFGIQGGMIHVPLGTGKALLDFSGAKNFGAMTKLHEGEYRSLIVRVGDRRNVESVKEKIEALGYGTFMLSDFLWWINLFFGIVEAGLALFGGIGLFVSCFGIANTMLMAVLERTREIGVLKALGGRDRDVRRAFLFEAAGIGLGGGLVGVAFGKLAGLILNAIANYWLASDSGGRTVMIFYVPLWLALGSIGFAAVTAAVAGLYPAWRAAKLDPVEALRRE